MARRRYTVLQEIHCCDLQAFLVCAHDQDSGHLHWRGLAASWDVSKVLKLQAGGPQCCLDALHPLVRRDPLSRVRFDTKSSLLLLLVLLDSLLHELLGPCCPEGTLVFEQIIRLQDLLDLNDGAMLSQAQQYSAARTRPRGVPKKGKASKLLLHWKHRFLATEHKARRVPFGVDFGPKKGWPKASFLRCFLAPQSPQNRALSHRLRFFSGTAQIGSLLLF